jgi:hypothetical protein
MTDAAAQAKALTPKAPPEPVVTPPPVGGPVETEKEKQVRIDNQLKALARLRESISKESVNEKIRKSITTKNRSSKPEEAVVVPGVGKIQYHAGVFGGRYTYWNEKGEEIKTLEEFNNLRIEEDKKLQKQQIQLMNERPDLLSSAYTESSLLQTSAEVGATERSMMSKPLVVSVPVPSAAAGDKKGNDSMLVTSLSAAGGVTPSWLKNANLS